jgi:hypothetical protein
MIVNFYVPETTDRRVTEEDAAIFGRAATIHEVLEPECLTRIRGILRRTTTYPRE